MSITDILGKRMVFFDGAMGTMLQERGLGAGELPELWNVTRPEIISDIHRAYLEAGCDILKTNTFGANRSKLKGSGCDANEVIAAGVGLARRAIDQFGGGYAAMDIGPTGKLLQPLGDLGFEEAYALFRDMAIAGEMAGADLILIETMSDTYEVKAAVLAAKENTSLPVVASVVFDERGKLLTGGDVAATVALLEGLGVDVIGVNCGLGPDQFIDILKSLKSHCSVPISMCPNAGLPRSVGGRTVFDVGPEQFAADMARLALGGSWIVGGCCGTTPEHIAATVRACREIVPVPLARHEATVVSSYSMAVEIGPRPVVIGERINPTGKPRFKQALREDDMQYILGEGLSQQDAGADILDVNVGLPEIDEKAVMARVVSQLQSVISLPLQIDTSDPKALEAALRLYNGKALVNSVNGKRESMEAVFPLVKKYGGAVVALALDESGIPDTARGRLEIARKIVDTAAEYGIDKKDIIVDALTMAVSADPEAANTTLEALRLIKSELGVKTILGVSNVSFGLPSREVLNAAFYKMALKSGLDAAIINPLASEAEDCEAAFNALSGRDEQFAEYISKYSDAKPAPKTESTEKTSLYDAIVRGLRGQARDAAEDMARETPPLEIINKHLVPALDIVGAGYEVGTVFLPQLLMSAEAAKAAFEAVRAAMERSGAGGGKKDKIVLATVKGDIHDIGKNIVKALLENYGYDVIDLGRDVPPETVVDAVLKNSVKLAGLSALMTTTVSSMAETIRQLRGAAPECRVMVGGAVLTQEYADMIGADFYGKDAVASVRYAQELLG